MLKMRKFVGLILGFTILLMCNISAFAAPQNTNGLLSFNGKLNCEMVSEIPAGAKPPMMATNDNRSDFSIDLKMNSDELYTGVGYILLEDGMASYIASGKLLNYTLKNGDLAYIGTITGDVFGGSQTLSLTIHTIPKQGKTFVLANSAIKDENGIIVDNKVYPFGELFDEMNEFVPMYMNDMSNNGKDDEDGGEIETYSIDTDAYNTKFVNTSITAYGTENGGYYELIALSTFAPDAVRVQGNHYMYAKVNSNIDNATKYARTFLTVGVITGMNVKQGVITMTAEKDEMAFIKQEPESKTVNVKIPVPIPNYINGGITTKTITIPWIKVDADLVQVGDYNSTGLTNRAYWMFGGIDGISWSSSVAPKDTTKAYAGNGNFTNYKNLRYDTTCNIEVYGSLSYGYTSQYGAIQYAGDFGASASYDCSITLAKAP